VLRVCAHPNSDKRNQDFENRFADYWPISSENGFRTAGIPGRDFVRISSQCTSESEGAEQTGSQSYIPPDPKDDKALHTALDLIRGIQKNSAYPPNPKTAVPN